MLCSSRNTLRRAVRRQGRQFSSNASSPHTPNPLPAAFMRGGTSKGIFINANHLPQDQSQWKPILLGLMGSPDPIHGRQLNGMGGGVSSLSKVCVVGAPSAATLIRANKERRECKGHSHTEPVDIEYTFVQVGIKDDSIDLSGNCGNLSSMVGVFALDAGLLTLPRLSKDKVASPTHGNLRTATVRAFNTNTQKFISTSFPVATSSYTSPDPSDRLVTPILDLPQASVAGVPGQGSQIILQFHNPAGARTGKLLPTGTPTTALEIDLPSGKAQVTASLVDATNPTVFVSYDQLATELQLPLEAYIKGQKAALDQVSPVLEKIRQAGATVMQLDPTAQAQPKIAILSTPSQSSLETDGTDIVVHALSMGVLHKAVPMTVGLCLGVAAKTEGTLAWSILQRSRAQRGQSTDGDLVRILHPSGLVDVGAEIAEDGSVKSAQVVRTGRRLMTGHVYW